MKHLLLLFNLFFICLLANAQYDNDLTENFKEYINHFQNKQLPINLDRKTVFGIATYNTNEYQEIESIYNRYLPFQLLNDSTNYKSRCIFHFDILFELIPLLIAKDIYENDEQRELELYLVLYKQNGEIVDCKYISGFKIDIKEKFAQIEEDFKITTKEYQFKIPEENNYPNLYYARETIENWEVKESGTFFRIDENITNGYFNGDWEGYKLIHKE